MNKLLILLSIILVSACSHCSGQRPSSTKYITRDSTLVFTFEGDTLYVDTYESGCGLETYYLTDMKIKDGETLYKGYYEDEPHDICLYGNVSGGHWEYFIKFDNESVIPLIKISP